MAYGIRRFSFCKNFRMILLQETKTNSLITRVVCQRSESSSNSSPSDTPKSVPTHRVNKVDKYILVWTKKYKSVSEVPEVVMNSMMELARNKARIKLNIYMCIVTALICCVMVYSGKQAAKRGESVSKINVDWHKSMNEKSKE